MLFYFESRWLNIILAPTFLLLISSFLMDLVSTNETNFPKEKKETIILNKFEDKYIEDVKKIKERELTDEQLIHLKYSFVFENTPMGHVVMYYDQETKMFFYYCDRKDIPYKYLDVVARKYVKIFDCKIIYTLMYDELEASKNKLEEVKEKNNILMEMKKKETSEKPKKKDIFATYKTYNIKSDKPVKDEDYLIKENINKFKCAGFLREYQFIKGKKYNDEKEGKDGKEEKKEITYQEYIASQSLSLSLGLGLE
tara:strand:+ start:128 stop:889 length:762 start_codon:yes stop_codon:yes gene_type:complete